MAWTARCDEFPIDPTTMTDREETQLRPPSSERLAAIGELIVASVHESRNALQQIQACLALLEAKIEGDEEARELIADLRKAQDYLYRLFEDVHRYRTAP